MKIWDDIKANPVDSLMGLIGLGILVFIWTVFWWVLP